MQVDGSFVIYRGDNERAPVNTALWSSAKTDDGFYNPNLGSYHMTMQSDGNLVIYDDAPTATNTTDSEQEATVTLTYSKTTSTEWGTETTLEIGTTFSASAGIPGVGEAGVEVSSTVTQGFTWNKSESETKEISTNLRGHRKHGRRHPVGPGLDRLAAASRRRPAMRKRRQRK